LKYLVTIAFLIFGGNLWAVEYDCEGEDSEHVIEVQTYFDEESGGVQMDFLQSTQHQGPFPLPPMRYHIEDLIGRNRIFGGVEYEFAPSNYQDCSYQWTWPRESRNHEEFSTVLGMNCDGVESQIELLCSQSDR